MLPNFVHERRLPRLTCRQRVRLYGVILGTFAGLSVWMLLGPGGYGQTDGYNSLYFGESFGGVVTSHYLRVETPTGSAGRVTYHWRIGYLVLHLLLCVAAIGGAVLFSPLLAKRWPPPLREWCDRCGYDRQGKLDGPCPECGYDSSRLQANV